MSAKSPRFPRCAAVLRGNDSRCQKDKALLDVAEVITPPKTNVGDFLYCQMILRKVFNQPQVKTTRGGRTKSVINAKQKLDKVFVAVVTGFEAVVLACAHFLGSRVGGGLGNFCAFQTESPDGGR